VAFDPNFGERHSLTIAIEEHHGQLARLKDRG
jgi:hypothetical protein